MPSDIVNRLIELAKQADAQNEIPIAAILVKDEKIIAEAFNQTEKDGSFLSHAELKCLDQATKKLGTKYLNDTTLYVSVEPCQMCLGAARLSRVASVYYLCPSEKFGEDGRAYFNTLVSQAESIKSQTQQENLMSDFFKKLRSK